jgi:hypothetical protein
MGPLFTMCSFVENYESGQQIWATFFHDKSYVLPSFDKKQAGPYGQSPTPFKG